MRILFIDDGDDIRELFGICFRLANHTAQTASDGPEALAYIQHEEFDAVVLDIEMPKMSGWDVLREIRRLPQGKELPIVLFTGYSDPSFEDRAHNLGADRLLHKPLTPSQIVTALKEVIAAKENHELEALGT